MGGNVVLEKSFDFAVRVVELNVDMEELLKLLVSIIKSSKKKTSNETN